MYATTISTPCAQQTLAALHVIQGKDGTTRGAEKLQRLHDNSNFFRDSLRAMGCEVLGDTDSPVMPVMLYNPGKISAFSRECLARHLAMVVVGFPATPLLLSRARVCISASHTREELEAALRVLDDVVDLLGIRYSGKKRPASKLHANGHSDALTNGHAR
jgi:serine palmitoyltransferase